MFFALLYGNLFEYHQGIRLDELIFLISFTLIVVIISRYVFRIKLENNLFSEEELTAEPLYKQRDLLLQEKPIEFHRPEQLDEIPIITQPSWLLRLFILLVIVGFFIVPLQLTV